jgi:hypothetical protein
MMNTLKSLTAAAALMLIAGTAHAELPWTEPPDPTIEHCKTVLAVALGAAALRDKGDDDNANRLDWLELPHCYALYPSMIPAGARLNFLTRQGKLPSSFNCQLWDDEQKKCLRDGPRP